MKPQRIKILYLMDKLEWGETVGGTEGQFLQLLTNLDGNRFEPHLALFRASPYTTTAPAFPCPMRTLDIQKLVHPSSLLKLVKLGARVRAENFSIVHIFLNDASIVAPFFCHLGGARVIVSRRDMGFWYTEGNLKALRVSNRFVSRVIANSDAVRRNVHDREGFPVLDIEVVANGHDPARFDAAPLPGFRERLNIGADDPIVGMVANFNPWKRHVDLVRAFAAVRRQHPSAHLVMVGAGDTEPSRAAARELGLESSVHFPGGVADVMPVVKHFTMGVLCSESEGSSNAVIEYMGAGKPAICTSVGGNTELVRDEESGYLVAPGDVASLTDRISRLLAAPALAAAMGQRARQAVLGLTIRRMAESHMNLYERLARGREVSSPRTVGRMNERPDPTCH